MSTSKAKRKKIFDSNIMNSLESSTLDLSIHKLIGTNISNKTGNLASFTWKPTCDYSLEELSLELDPSTINTLPCEFNTAIDDFVSTYEVPHASSLDELIMQSATIIPTRSVPSLSDSLKGLIDDL